MKTIILYLCLSFLLVACGASPEEQAAMTATAMTATAAAWTPTPTATNTPTPTPTPTSTITPTPTLTPTATNTHTPTRDPNRYFAADGSFSMMTPAGFETQDYGLKYLGLVGPQAGGGNINLIFAGETNDASAIEYALALLEVLKATDPNRTLVSNESMTTPGGLEYIRMAVVYAVGGVEVQQIIYIFQQGDTKYSIIYTRPSDTGVEYDAMIDEAVNTFQFEK
jgi:hypothetical protein